MTKYIIPKGTVVTEVKSISMPHPTLRYCTHTTVVDWEFSRLEAQFLNEALWLIVLPDGGKFYVTREKVQEVNDD